MITDFYYFDFRIIYRRLLPDAPFSIDTALQTLKKINEIKPATVKDLKEMQSLAKEIEHILHIKEGQELTEETHHLALSLLPSSQGTGQLAEAYELCEQILKKKIDEETLSKKASEEIKEGKWYPCDFVVKIKEFNLTNVTFIRALAFQVAQESEELVSPYIKEWRERGWLDQTTLIEIAEMESKLKSSYSKKFFEYFDNYGIEDKEAIKKIVRFAFRKSSPFSSSVKYLRKYDLGKEFLLEIAKLQIGRVRETLEDLLINIQDYGFSPEDKEMIELINHMEEFDKCGFISLYIDRFGIKNSELLKEIALHNVSKGIKAQINLAQNIKKYHFDEQFLSVLIEKLIINPEFNISENIGFFGIENEDLLFKLACREIEKGKHQDVLRLIKNYGIKDQMLLKKLASELSRIDVSQHIDAFGIDDESFLIELAEKELDRLIRLRPDSIKEFASNLKNFKIKNQEILKRFVTTIVQYTPVSPFIYRIGITDTDEQFFIDLAQKELREAFKDRSRIEIFILNIRGFGISNPAIIHDFIKQCAKRMSISHLIHFVGITDQDFLIELATDALNECERTQQDLLENFHGYHIKDEKVRISFAKLLSRTRRKVSGYIHNFQISDEKALAEIAINDATKGAFFLDNMLRYFDNYPITNQIYIVKVFERIIQKSPQIALNNFEKFKISDEDTRARLFLECCKGLKKYVYNRALRHTSFEQFLPYPEAQQFLYLKDVINKKFPNQFNEILDQIDFDNEELLKFSIYWFVLTGINLQRHKPKETAEVSDWKQIFDCRDPMLAADLSERMVAVLRDPEAYQRFKDIITSSNGKKLNHMVLPALFLATQESTREINQLVEKLKKEKKFKDQRMVQNLAKVLFLLSEQKQLSLEAIFLIDKAITAKGMKINLYAIQGIAACGGLSLLKETSKEAMINFSKIYETVFKQAIPIQERVDFTKAYFETFGLHSNHFALLTYAGQLKALPEHERNEAMKHLVTFVDSVLDKKFNQIRYEGSKHLDFVFKKEGLKKGWEKNVSQPLYESSIFASEALKMNVSDYLKEKLLKEERLDLTDYPELNTFLRTSHSLEKKEIREKLISLSQEISKKEKALDNEIDCLKAKQAKSEEENSDIEAAVQRREELRLAIERIRFQLDLMDFIELGNPNNETLNKILFRLKKLPKTAKFVDDIIELIQKIEKAIHAFPEELNGYTLVNTDDPILLFFSGDILESCMKFDGNAQQSKCLLAYLLDGKCRLMAVLDKNGNIVERRIVRLLFNKKTGEPVLMQEPLYRSHKNQKISEALSGFVRQQAERLGVSLYSVAGKESQDVLVSLNSKLPWEYVDSIDPSVSLQGRETTGNYEIFNPKIVYKVEPVPSLSLTP